MFTTDFHLQTGSPAIGAGTAVGLSLDFDDVAWNTPPTIGAYEVTVAVLQLILKYVFKSI